MRKLFSILLAAVFTVALLGSSMTVFAEEEAPKASVVTGRNDDSAAKVPEYIGEALEEPENVNPLTGLDGYNTEAIGKRPVAVMINNHPNSYPQYNIGQADVIFEVVVEHTLTRMLAMFADYTDVPYLVSVRSYRYYFPAISQAFDAFYIHWGEDQTMMWYYEELGLDAYDGLSNTYLFGRDQDRLNAGYDLEHTSCFYGSLLPDQLGWDNKRTDLQEEYLGDAFNFVPFGTVRIPGGQECRFVDIQFGQQTAQFTYDEDKGVYLKYANENPQIDGISGEQLEFENVLVLYTLIFDREEDEADRKFLNVFGGTDTDYAVGYYASEGSVQKIKWGRAEYDEDADYGVNERSRFKFYDEDGNEIDINRGKTYIAFTYSDTATVSDTIPEQYLP